MAIFIASTKSISRGKGQSAVASASYRAGVELQDERYGKKHDYSKRHGVMSADIILPNSLKDKEVTIDRGTLWNLAEKSENRKDARVAREWLVNLPYELEEEERKQLAHTFSQELADRYNVIADCAIHRPTEKEIERGADARNFHAHIMLTTRQAELDQEGNITLTDKSLAELSDKKRRSLGLERMSEEVKQVRQIWERVANEKLLEHGHDLIDSRSYAEQGIDILPQLKMGKTATHMERDGKQTLRGEINRAITERNELVFNREIKENDLINERADQIIFESRKRNEQTNDRLRTAIDRAVKLTETSVKIINHADKLNDRNNKHVDISKRQIERAERAIDTADKQTIITDTAINRVSEKFGLTERAIDRADRQTARTDRAINKFTEQLNSEFESRSPEVIEKFVKAVIAFKFVNQHSGSFREKAERIISTYDDRQKSTIQNFSKNYNLDIRDPAEAGRFKYDAKQFINSNIKSREVIELAKILLDPKSERLEYAKTLSNERQSVLTENSNTHTLDVSKTQQRANRDVSNDDYEPPMP